MYFPQIDTIGSQCNSHKTFVLKALCTFVCMLSMCVQGEQCNVVPDTIDDIVADIGQEEKEEGTVAHTLTLPLLITVIQGNTPNNGLTQRTS